MRQKYVIAEQPASFGVRRNSTAGFGKRPLSERIIGSTSRWALAATLAAALLFTPLKPALAGDGKDAKKPKQKTALVQPPLARADFRRLIDVPDVPSIQSMSLSRPGNKPGMRFRFVRDGSDHKLLRPEGRSFPT